ncbi:hypothetical protein Tco_1018252 [Tanacetum coccineum]|uniref:Glycosyltransferase family 92 protein n=1 Tax=Tanacetum coccineum TaxID=301880 RepID=A0ABQ5FWE8_9ASTR
MDVMSTERRSVVLGSGACKTCHSGRDSAAHDVGYYKLACEYNFWHLVTVEGDGGNAERRSPAVKALNGLDNKILPWIYYHKVVGVANFFLFVEGEYATAGVSKVLESIHGVKLVHRTKELEEEQDKSRMWNETPMSRYLCNYELFVKQYLNTEMAVVMAEEAHMDWIFYLDTNEALLNETTYMNLSVRSRLFKKNYDHLTEEIYYGNYKESVRRYPRYFLTYSNGKSAARVQQHLRPNGAHRWYNYKKIPNAVMFHEAAVLHYIYAKFSDLTSRLDRCGCKPTKEHVKKCFFLEFDSDAFIIVSSSTE